jgi:hypothetical protein
VGTEDDALTLRHLVQIFDEHCALALESFEYEAVMHDLMTYIERTAVFVERAANRFNSAIDSGAESAWLG